MEGNHLESNNEKQVFLSESEEISKDDPPADFDISIEELTAKLAEKKKDNKIVEEKLKELHEPKISEEKVVLEIKEEFENKEENKFPIKIEEEKPKSFSIKIEEEKQEHSHEPTVTDHRPLTTDHKPQTTDHRSPTTHHRPQKTFLQRHRWLLAFTLLLVVSYFWFHPAENNLNSFAVNAVKEIPKESVVEIPQTPPVEKIDLRGEKLRNLIIEGIKD